MWGRDPYGENTHLAEFLDNALSEECLGSFESNCIESDVQLCEAAECHQFLSEMLGQHELMAELTDEESRKLFELTSKKSSSPAGQVGHATDMENARAVRAELDTLALDERCNLGGAQLEKGLNVQVVGGEHDIK